MTTQRILLASLVATLACWLQGCAHTAATESSPAPAAAPAASGDTGNVQKKDDDLPGGIIGTIPARSPFAMLSIGMTKEDVDAKLGAPASQHYYPTGKAFIPFYMGDDRMRAEYRYKGLGVITFSSGGGWNAAKNFTVYRVVYDPREDGESK